jgi:hypothetical protein
MKHVKKNSLAALHELFDERLTADSVSEPFDGLDAASDAATAREFAARRGFDIIGVQRGGRCIGFARVDELRGGALGDYVRPLEEQAVVAESNGLRDTVNKVFRRQCVFVDGTDGAYGIVTRGDMNKAPVRMLLFSLVTVLEMQMLRVLRMLPHSDTYCYMHLDPKTISIAERTKENRKKFHADSDLLDCLMFQGRRVLIQKLIWSDVINVRKVGIQLDASELDQLERIEHARNEVAHGNDLLLIDSQYGLVEVLESTERLLRKFERAQGRS